MNRNQGMWTTSRDDRHLARRVGHLDAPDLELVYRFRWNSTQVIVIAVGVFLMALGGIGLARAGAVGITDAVTPEVVVGTWHRTPLMAAIELVIGLLLIVSGAQRLSPRGLYRAAGAVRLVFGIVLIAQPSTFDSALGASRDTGWLCAILGFGLLVLGFGAPIVFEGEQVTTLGDGPVSGGIAVSDVSEDPDGVPDNAKPAGGAARKAARSKDIAQSVAIAVCGSRGDQLRLPGAACTWG